MNSDFDKNKLPVKPRRGVNVFAIVLGLLVLGLVGLLVYNYFFTPSEALSEGKAYELLDRIKNSKETPITIPNSNFNYSGNIEEIIIYNQNGQSASTGTVVINYYFKNTSTTQTLKYSAGLTVNNVEEFRETIKNTYPGFFNSTIVKESFPTTVAGIFLSSFSFLIFIIPSLLFFYFFFYRMRSGLNVGGSYEGAKLIKSNIMFSDVAGIKEEKRELLEIVEFLKKPRRYIGAGARIPKGLLLYGPPGTGKTLLAKAVSGESHVPFFSAAGSSFEGMFVGLGASRIRELFIKAKKNAPCIIFIDEIDSLGSKRQNTFSSVQSQSLNQFLSELDGFESKEGIIVVAATNRIEVLDSALLRSGRFDRKIQINLPDVKERAEILRIHSRNKRLSDDISFDEIANRTPGFSGAELENSLNEAALQAVRKNRTVIQSQDIDEGIDRVIGGPAKTSRVVNRKTRTIVALHESGHALIGLVLSDAAKVQKVTIIPRGSAGGYTVTTPKDETLLYSKETLNHQVIGLLGGRAAEETILGPNYITTGAYDDFTKATNIVERMVKEFGMSELGVRFTSAGPTPVLGTMSPLSETMKAKIDQQIDAFLNHALAKAKKLILANKKLLFLLAEALLILETITASQIDYIHRQHQLPAEALAVKSRNPGKVYLDLTQFQTTTTTTSKLETG